VKARSAHARTSVRGTRSGSRIGRPLALAALGMAAVAGGAVAVHTFSGPAGASLTADAGHQAGAAALGARSRPSWSFSTLDNRNDPTFNQLLGINDHDQIAGYFGSGAQGHPNKGYLLLLSRRGSQYVSENVPGAVQTQVTGLNNRGVTVGFWSGQNTASQMNANVGFYTWAGRFHSVAFPSRASSSPPVNQLLGVSDADVAVGFWTDSRGNAHGYTYSLIQHRFRAVTVPGAVSVTAAGINDAGVVAGFYTGPGGVTRAFTRGPAGRITRLTFPGASATQAFGINNLGEVAGTYMTGSGKSAESFGFTWTRGGGFRSVTDPLGRGTTTINGVNDAGDLVGFYTGPAGRTHGLLWAAGHFTAPPAAPVAAPPMPGRPTMPARPMMPASPTMTAAPFLTVSPSLTASPTMAPTVAPTAVPTATLPVPNPSASPPGGPW
jgi:hypothetical protein